MTTTTMERQRLLQSLLELDRPLEKVLSDLSEIEWDGEDELVTLGPSQVIEILNRFKAGRLSAEDVERWANAIEAREDIGLDPRSRELLKAAIFELANPILQGPLTAETTNQWLARLIKAPKEGARNPKGS